MNSRQKSIGVTVKEKERLDKAKLLYEQCAGKKVDWGIFLELVTALGLAKLGIYEITEIKGADQSSVTCPRCGSNFSIAYSDEVSVVAYVQCPHNDCKCEIIVHAEKECTDNDVTGWMFIARPKTEEDNK